MRDRRWERGPTIPYLIGVMRIHQGKCEIAPTAELKADLLELLTSMRDETPPDVHTYLWPCPTVEAIVVTSRPDPPLKAMFIESPFRAGRGVWYSIQGSGIQNNLESLADTLWNMHQNELLEGRFNRVCNAGTESKWDFVLLDDSEREEIRLTLANPVARTKPLS